MNEVMTLRFVDFDPHLAAWMVECGRSFATMKAGGPTGQRRGVAFARPSREWVCFAYWTQKRAVVVVEQPKEVP